MLTLSYLLIVTVSLGLAYWALDTRLHLTHKIRQWRHRRYWRQRNAREQRHRKLETRTPK
ncbi:hypothetical protein [Phenylobacterium sp.]|uniref:hypothetical protein n=1 Tax=Phenylobacterium sp. TaxID=1871053 RepID=UPI00286D4128|nr:hypothetical protein [Phenylobacterium sp.]